MLKKYLAILLVLAMISGVMFSATVSAEEPETNDDIDKKVYNTMTIDDDFDDRTLLVVLNKNKSWEKDVFTTEDFLEIDAVEIEDLSYGVKELIEEQQFAMESLDTTAEELIEQEQTSENWEEEIESLPDELLDNNCNRLHLANPDTFRRVLKRTYTGDGTVSCGWFWVD